jgi:hypothetical protein
MSREMGSEAASGRSGSSSVFMPQIRQHVLGDVVRVDLQSGEPLAEDTVVFALGSPYRLPQANR